MRHARLASSPPKRPLVGIIVDCSNTFGRAILRGVTRYANLQRRWLLFKDLEKAPDISVWPNLDAAVIAGVPWELSEAARARCPHIVQCSGAGDTKIGPVVALDDIACGEQAAQHLLDCGLESFAFYGAAPFYKVPSDRLAGFSKTVESRGFRCSVSPTPRPTSEQRLSHTHRPAVIEWLKSLPKRTGIMAFDDTNAHDLAEVCLEAGIHVPEDVSIVGVNNDDLLCDSAWPPISSVEADFTRMGYRAAEVLDRMLSGSVPARDQSLTLLPPLGVVQRQSTNVLAVNDPNIVDAIRFIRDHACDPCSVGDVLREVPVGRRWLERNFMTHLGRSPHDEIARVRVETAQRLLRVSDKPMIEIAQICGFGELKNFYVAFRRVVGVTPAAYRRKAIIGA